MRHRAATRDDAARIAALHAESWRHTYAFALDSDFIANSLDDNRSQIWAERMSAPRANQHVILAEDGTDLVGFACLYGNDDPVYGTLLDNLHVRRSLQRTGVGRGLIIESAAWCLANHPGSGLYLWVLDGNSQARGFYSHLGAADAGAGTWAAPGGGGTPMQRRAWSRGQLREIVNRSDPQ